MRNHFLKGFGGVEPDEILGHFDFEVGGLFWMGAWEDKDIKKANDMIKLSTEYLEQVAAKYGVVP
jgi:hypothetical protein